jgi:transposase-like protein
LSVAEQRYLAVMAEGETVSDVAARFGVTRKTVHAWLNKYGAGGLEALGDGSHRPRSGPHQMPGEVEVALVGDASGASGVGAGASGLRAGQGWGFAGDQ